MAIKIWVDADAAPTEVKEIVFRAALRLKLETILVANRKITTPAAAPMVRSVTVSHGADVADRYIVKHCSEGDLAITADLPLAADLVAMNVNVIDPRGDVYDADNIASRLSARHFYDSLRGTGVQTGGAAPYSDKDKRLFAASLDRLLARITKR